MKLFGDKAKHNLSTNSTNLIRGDIKMNKMRSQRPESLHSGSEPATAKHRGAEWLACLTNYMGGQQEVKLKREARLGIQDLGIWIFILTVMGVGNDGI